MTAALLILAAYFLGACPFGLLVAGAHGVNIREVGSGNIGATNVFRTVGKGAGSAVFVLDALKGFVPAFFFPTLARALGDDTMASGALGLWCGLSAIVGHNYSVYLRFHGGKGVATSAGALFGLVPLAAVLGIAAWIVLLLATGYVSVASVGAAIAVPIAAWCLYGSHEVLLPSALTVLGALIVFRHHTNLRRLWQGTEHRFDIWGRGKKIAAATETDESPPPS